MTDEAIVTIDESINLKTGYTHSPLVVSYAKKGDEMFQSRWTIIFQSYPETKVELSGEIPTPEEIREAVLDSLLPGYMACVLECLVQEMCP